MPFSKINIFLLGLFVLNSCNSQKEVIGRYENKFSVSSIERPFFHLRGLTTLKFQYNLEFYEDSTYKVDNCICESSGNYLVRNDSLILVNTYKSTNDSIEICFDSFSYRIKNNGKTLVRREGKQIERLHKVK